MRPAALWAAGSVTLRREVASAQTLQAAAEGDDNALLSSGSLGEEPSALLQGMAVLFPVSNTQWTVQLIRGGPGAKPATPQDADLSYPKPTQQEIDVGLQFSSSHRQIGVVVQT